MNVTCHGRVTAMSLPTDVRTYGRDATRRDASPHVLLLLLVSRASPPPYEDDEEER